MQSVWKIIDWFFTVALSLKIATQANKIFRLMSYWSNEKTLNEWQNAYCDKPTKNDWK